MTSADPILSALATLGETAAADSKRKLADSKKNQTEALRACANKDLTALTALLDQGMSPNFLGEREGGLRSPLQFAMTHRWSEGIDALLAAGARDGALGELWEGQNTASPALLVAAQIPDGVNFFKVLAKETDPKLREQGIRRGLMEVSLCVSLLTRVDAAEISFDAAKAAFSGFINTGSGRAHAEVEASLCALLERFPKCCESPNRAWIKVLDEDMPKLCKALARAGIAPSSPNWSTAMEANNFQDHWLGCAPSRLIKKTSGSYYAYRSIDKATIEVGALARAALRGSVNTLASLLQIAPLKALFSADSTGREALSYARAPEGLKALSEAGIDLSEVKDDQGRNPLHQACRFAYGKKAVETLCRIRPEWVEERDADGKRPIELSQPKDAPGFALIFDKVGLRDALKGRKGKRTGEASKPRRL